MLDIELDQMPTFEDMATALKGYREGFGIRVELRLLNQSETHVVQMRIFGLKYEWNEEWHENVPQPVLCAYGELVNPVRGTHDRFTIYENPLCPAKGLGLLYKPEEDSTLNEEDWVEDDSEEENE